MDEKVRDRFTPRCMVCEEPMPIGAWIRELEASQGLCDWLTNDVLPDDATFIPTPGVCERCKHDGERVTRLFTPARVDAFTEEMRQAAALRRRMDEVGSRR